MADVWMFDRFYTQLQDEVLECLNNSKRGVTTLKAAINRVHSYEKEIFGKLHAVGPDIGYKRFESYDNLEKILKKKDDVD